MIRIPQVQRNTIKQGTMLSDMVTHQIVPRLVRPSVQNRFCSRSGIHRAVIVHLVEIVIRRRCEQHDCFIRILDGQSSIPSADCATDGADQHPCGELHMLTAGP